MAPTWVRRIQAAAKRMQAWTLHVATKAKTSAKARDRLFEFAFNSDIDRTWLLCVGRVRRWFRVSFIDGGGRLVKYEDGVFEKFDRAVSDATESSIDPTLLFLATDGSRIYKAFAGPVSAVGENNPYLSKGFDDGEFIGIWSHAWLHNVVEGLETTEDPDGGWTAVMEDMVMAIADYADTEGK